MDAGRCGSRNWEQLDTQFVYIGGSRDDDDDDQHDHDDYDDIGYWC